MSVSRIRMKGEVHVGIITTPLLLSPPSSSPTPPSPGVTVPPLHDILDDDFVTDVRGMPSYGDLVKEKVYALGGVVGSSSNSASSSMHGSKLQDSMLDRRIIFQHCSLSAIQVGEVNFYARIFNCYAVFSRFSGNSLKLATVTTGIAR